MNENNVTLAREEYLYVVHGVIPEAMPTVAYRRVGRSELVDRKIIKCPYCREILTDVDRHTLVQIYRLPKGKRAKTVPGQRFLQCVLCKNEVGVVMI